MDDLKTRERFTSSVDKELLAQLRDLSKATMIPISKLLDKAIELIVNEYKALNK